MKFNIQYEQEFEFLSVRKLSLLAYVHQIRFGKPGVILQ